MNYFSHTIAEYVCIKRCGFHVSLPSANWGLFHLMFAVVATVPLWVYSLWEGMEWYYFVSILAGELLLAYLAGFLAGAVSGPFQRVSHCKQCGARMMFCGRHFNPAGSPKPHRSDIAISIVFTGLNIALWYGLVTGNFNDIIMNEK